MDTEERSEFRDLKPSETVILLAEDDPLVRNLVQLILSKQGFTVLAANDGKEALEICGTFKDQIHLLLTDVRMPRMSGLELAEKVREQRPETRILIMSAETIATIAAKNTPDAFLGKPFIPPTLLQCVQRLLTSSFRGICNDSELL
jgi:CheY-like chemotaxis protein